MSDKHTAGPWVEAVGDGRSDGYVREARATEDGRHIAVAQVSKTGRSYSEFRANKALVAAAPAMLSALRAAADALSSADYFRAMALNPHTRAMSERALAEVRAAILIASPADE